MLAAAEQLRWQLRSRLAYKLCFEVVQEAAMVWPCSVQLHLLP